MNRRGFLRSMLCTAAAAVVPMPAIVSESRYFIGVDTGIVDSTAIAVIRQDGDGVLTLEAFREAVAILRREAVPMTHVFVHPANLIELEECDACDDEGGFDAIA